MGGLFKLSVAFDSMFHSQTHSMPLSIIQRFPFIGYGLFEGNITTSKKTFAIQPITHSIALGFEIPVTK